MNYTLVNYKFIEIKEREGFIENNSGDLIELVITDTTPVLNNPNNIYLKESEKYKYELKDNQKLYGKTVKRVEGCINVFEGKLGSEPVDAYTKQESDTLYRRKKEHINSIDVYFNDNTSLQDKLDNGDLGNGEPGATFTPEVTPQGMLSWTNDKGLDNPDPVDIKGKTGSVGMSGTPALNNEIYKEGAEVKTKYTGERNLVGIYGYTNGHSTEFDSYPFTQLHDIILKELPNGTQKVRLKQVTFAGYTDAGVLVGTNTKNKDSGTQPHLGVLDPSLQTELNVTGSSVVLHINLKTKDALAKELLDLKGKYMQGGITKVGSMQVEYEVLGANDRPLGSTSIIEYYLDSVNDNPKTLFNLSELKGDKGNGLKDIKVNVETTTGIPTVNVVKSGTDQEQIYTLNFSGLKGESTASIESATATVDDKTGTPSVEIVLGGTPTNRTLQFNFKNLKGRQGDAGVKGNPGADGRSAFNGQGQIEYPNGTKEWIE